MTPRPPAIRAGLTCLVPVGKDPDLVIEQMDEANPHVVRRRCLRCGTVDNDWTVLSTERAREAVAETLRRHRCRG